MTNLVRILKNSWKNFSRNIWLSVAALFMMVTALSVVGGLLLFDASLNVFVAGLQDKVDVSVYFKQDTNESNILQVMGQLKDRQDIKSVRYISQNEALSIFTARHADNDILLESLEEIDTNPLQASLNIRVFQTEQFESVVVFLEASSASEFIDDINFRENEKVINSISNISRSIRRTGVIFMIILITLVVFVTLNTIRIAIYTAKEEIYIMKLVGGSNWFVRTPFILTGALYGIISSLFVLVFYFLGTRFLRSKLSLIFADIDLYAYLTENALNFSLTILVAGVSLGMVSSWLAVRRYLKV